MRCDPDDIAIVIVNWNRRDDLLVLLDSLYDAGYSNYDIIVIDNASTDDSVTALREKYPGVKLIQNAENLGGTGGFNTGLRYVLGCDYSFVWLLDNDAVALPEALEALVDVMTSDSSIGLVGSKLLHPADTTLINEIGADINPFTARPKPKHMNERDRQLPSVLDVDYVAVCSVLVRLSAVKRVGLMDEAYFLMWDDMEWGMRFGNAGYRVVAATKSCVTHPGFSERLPTSNFIYYATRNHFYFIAKTYTGLHRYFLIALLAGTVAYHNRREQWMIGETSTSKIRDAAEKDFWELAMRRTSRIFDDKKQPRRVMLLETAVEGATCVALSTSTSEPVVRSLVSRLKANGIKVMLFGRKRRQEVFSWFDGLGVWRRPSTFGYLQFLWQMWHHRCDATIVYYEEMVRLPMQFGHSVIRLNCNMEVVSVTHAKPIASIVSELALLWAAVLAFSIAFCRTLVLFGTKDTLRKVEQVVVMQKSTDYSEVGAIKKK